MKCCQSLNSNRYPTSFLEGEQKYAYTTSTYCMTPVYVGIENLFTMRDLASPAAFYLPKNPDSKMEKNMNVHFTAPSFFP